MSDTDGQELMDVDSNYDPNQHFAESKNQQHPTSTDKPAAVNVDEDEALAVLSLKWIKPDEPGNMKRLECILEKMLQSWFNNQKLKVDCSVERTLTDGCVVIKIEPPSAIIELQKLSKQTLTGKDGNSVYITAVSLTLPSAQADTQVPEEASINLPSTQPEPQTDQVQREKQSNTGPAAGEESGTSSMSDPQTEQVQLEQQSNTAAAAAEEMNSCSVPLSLFWYVNHMYEEEMKRIEKENGVKIRAEVKVRLESDQKDGSPDKAYNEFINLFQKSTVESSGSVIPLKSTAPDQWSDALKIIKKKENKLLVTLTSEKMTVCGPRQSQEVIRKVIYADAQQKNTNGSFEKNEREISDTSLKIDMTTKDNFPDAGLIMEERYWKLMYTSYNEQVKRIKEKFNVELKESDIGQGKVSVKAFYNKDEGNASMESHALKALLRLCQKIAASPMKFSLFNGASGSSGSPMNTNSISQSAGASNELVLNGQSANADAPRGGGATAGDSEAEKCSICLDTFKNKKQLKCKHEFCEECLQQAKEVNGPICPVCRVVFGKIMGDQPDGKMSHYTPQASLPGFPGCGTIVINYEIPSGIQTQKHPNPGQRYWGIKRQAYLPNNSEGNEVLRLLTKAFNQGLIFTIGTSRTTGMDGQVTWNDIHHKTSTSGGPQWFGYPDPEYLSRVKEELKAKGIE